MSTDQERTPIEFQEIMQYKNVIMMIFGGLLLLIPFFNVLADSRIQLDMVVLAIIGAVLFYSGLTGKRHDEMMARL